MRVYRLERKQTINVPIEKAWSFFSTPENLDLLTPDDMKFEIVTERPIPTMYEGQILDYKVAPILNIPMKWRSKITEVKEERFFIDEQVSGPYKLWRHRHRFDEKDGKTEMTDIVEYALPFSIIGTISHFLFVKKRLQQIFNYRYQKVEALFN